MRIGVTREIKIDEYRVALTPAGARELIQRGHEVLVEVGAGVGSQFADEHAYETVETESRALPLLAPMSEVAGRIAPQAEAPYLERPYGGRGVLLGGVLGVAPGKELAWTPLQDALAVAA